MGFSDGIRSYEHPKIFQGENILKNDPADLNFQDFGVPFRDSREYGTYMRMKNKETTTERLQSLVLPPLVCIHQPLRHTQYLDDLFGSHLY